MGRRTHRYLLSAVLLLALPVAAAIAAPNAGTRIGSSVEERPIEAHTVGSGSSVIALIGGIHTGPEAESVHIVEALLAHFRENETQIPEAVSLVFVPKANPDGYERGTRVNARGVDLNRNWPTEDWQPEAVHGDHTVDAGSRPLSEPETAALYEYLLELRPLYVLSYHAYAALIENNGIEASERLSEAYAQATGLEHIDEWPYYPITGEFIVAMAEAGIAAADVELERGDRRGFQRHLAGVRAVMEHAAERQAE